MPLTDSVLKLYCGAVLFDMDGTLVDSTICVERQWHRWASRHGLDGGRILAMAHGRRNTDTMREVAPHLHIEEEAARFDAEELEERDGIVAVGGVGALIHALHAEEWAVVTSAARRLAEIRLECAGLPIPAVLISAEDVRQGKPHPEGYLEAARRLGVAASQCLVVEDAPAGLQAGRAAGMRVLGVTTTFPASRLEGAPWVRDFSAVRLLRSNGGLLIEARVGQDE